MAEPAENQAAGDEQHDEHDEAEKQRVAALEAEVTRLREKLGDSGPDPQDEAVQAQLVRRASPQRIAALVLAVVIVSLALMIAIFTALSSGFSSVADKAAGMFVPGQGGSAAAPAPARRPASPAPPSENTPRAPGL